jgi:predicted transposase YbfD/YdcC
VEKRSVSAVEITPRTSGFAGARTLLAVHSERALTKKGTESKETRYYLSSLGLEHMRLEQQAQLIRGHWAAVENNTHWRKDTLMGEDGMRSRNAQLLANTALVRNALLALYHEEYGGQNMVAMQEAMQRSPTLALRLIRSI